MEGGSGSLYDVDDTAASLAGDPSTVATVPRGLVRKVKNKSGQEEDKVVLRLRACISCRLIMSEQQFYDEGCPNCGFLQMDGDRHRVWDCTTVNFAGFVAVMKPMSSWVARHNKLTEVVPGCYAVSVVGELPESVKDDVHRASHYAD
ncbi:transcription elongation factor SPT4 [Toxoplasma gondii ME49]|uniref:Transcription elongation factor SPT4 n=14 Tax=Toxoplasma gondii TaxID=5811 RepID=B9PKI4_TOXGV|nr:transcription elongation factor SPT4 [Toxoplasma gondii ME49]EPR62729.1 transcription elongation factor SPT4 [Toxoplasma gondii GT1]ESS32106.1 transcription elongation factor SPT4 [Toxoplasma gondii VEG]KAF4641130.1 transcription elongation factor SPT4 [Toxoplasma gondii]KFG39674.1 transcription elongation factor SPT4 [Toxoplasma gondii p89]KFG49343.1 transcription elongation factor SPT4 [Toxoplasma gondii GAB2-2007-GAL-DOM2]KFG52774.1 transcription elongation factor SPT4 [Toxoplasma gondi|eukprot:XP_002365265.1 transcription elongation factor SPT4 [Toxoplasma gondii ME49]